MVLTGQTFVQLYIGVNNMYDKFNGLLNNQINIYFPEIKIKINKKSENKPWITRTILNSINKKNTMYKHYMKSKSPSLLEKYKKYKNKLTTILRSAEKKYYADRLQRVNDNASKTWKVLNDMTGRNQARKSINQIEINDTLTEDKKLIADKFNEYFVNIGPELARNILPSTRKVNDFLTGDYISNQCFLYQLQNKKYKTSYRI